MKVIVDGEATDQFGRPGEDQDIGAFIQEINEQLGKTNRVLSNIKVDGDVLSEEHESVKCREVDELELEVSTLENLTIESISELGTYAHRFLDRIPEILEDWEDVTREQVDTYRDQVIEALQATTEVLSSIEELTNVDTEGTGRNKMMERARELRERLRDADPEGVRTIIEETAREYFENLLETLQSVLDEFERQRENMIEKVQDIQTVLNDLRDDVQAIVENAQEQGANLSEWLNLDKVGQMSEDLTRVNTIMNELDQAGILRTYFPPERHEKIRNTLKELREGIGRLFSLLEEQDPTQVVSVLRKEIEPYLDRAARMFDELEPEDDPEPRKDD